MSEWNRLDAQDPPFVTDIIVTDGDRVSLARFHRGILGTPRHWKFYGSVMRPTHWAAIPELPSEAA